jgi:hypothetical protein
MTVRDIQTEVVEAVVAYAQADDAGAILAKNQRDRTLAMAGPPNLKGMRRRTARTYAPSRRIKAAYRRAVRRGSLALKAWLKIDAVSQEDVQAWCANKKPQPRKAREKIAEAAKPAEAPKPGGGGKGGR